MTQYLLDRDSVRVLTDRDVTLTRTLPAQNYTVKFNQQMGLYLSALPEFALPSKVYGDSYLRAERILNTFLARKNQTTGVLLSGYKGSGKTLLTKMICTMSGLPVIMLPQGIPMGALLGELEKIHTPIVIMIDEMEKKFPSSNNSSSGNALSDIMDKDVDAQPSLLSFLDGTHSGHKLVLMTTNSVFGINEFLLGRPGRVFYHYKYESLSEEEIREYCSDFIKDKERLEEIVLGCLFMGRISYDALQAIVEEILRYNCTFKDAAAVMNLQSEFGSVYSTCTAEYFDKEGHPLTDIDMPKTFRFTPELPRQGYWLEGFKAPRAMVRKAEDEGNEEWLDKHRVYEHIDKSDLIRREGLSFFYAVSDFMVMKLTAEDRIITNNWYDAL